MLILAMDHNVLPSRTSCRPNRGAEKAMLRMHAAMEASVIKSMQQVKTDKLESVGAPGAEDEAQEDAV
jgi:hypothetical protein